ncbi:MAG: HAMP domain-containing sensor histidine kinase [Microthrixaceae bacterium]
MGLGARLALLLATVAAATALIVGAASYVTTDRQVTAEVDDFLRERSREIVDGQREQPRDRRDKNDNDEPVVSVSPDSEVQVLDNDGQVSSNTGVLLPVSSTAEDLASRDGSPTLETVTVDGEQYRVITEHLPGGGAVQVARSLDESTGLLDELQARILIVAGAVALFAAGVGWVVARRITRPLRALTDAVDEVAETQDFEVPVPEAGGDEVGRLARGFNRMLRALDLSQTQQRRLVQDAAHELRTPLTSVTANVDWLMHAPEVDAETRTETLAGVRRELGELNAVMSEIIELATDSREAPEMVPTDLAAVSRDASERFTQRTGRVLDSDIETISVVGSAEALDRAITNLLDNADKYSPPGLPVGLDVGPSGVFVDDSGPGIPPDERALVLERFYRSSEHRSEPGSGLGLSIVAGIVAQHGGEMYIGESVLGGARVGFTIPRG